MKKTLLLLVSLLLGMSGNSQEYYPLVKETHNWSVVNGGLGAVMKVCCTQTKHYKFSGDTTIQALQYKKILCSTDSINQTWDMIGFMREDTLQKKVWLRDLENQEGMMYDFNVVLGGEISLCNPFIGDTLTYELTKIDSILIQGEYRNEYTLTLMYDDWEEKWIEGIGSEFGIVNSNIYGITGGFRELLCFSDNTLQYINPKFETCHKTSFTPAITNQSIDHARLNQEYSYQITTTEIFDYDSISYFNSGSFLPAGLTLNRQTGLISGIPTEKGTFHQFLCVVNNGYLTDYLEADLVVDDITSIPSTKPGNKVNIYPLPSNDIIYVVADSDHSAYNIKVTDLTGKQLLANKLEGKRCDLNISELREGIYLICILNWDTGETIITRKLIKQ